MLTNAIMSLMLNPFSFQINREIKFFPIKKYRGKFPFPAILKMLSNLKIAKEKIALTPYEIKPHSEMARKTFTLGRV